MQFSNFSPISVALLISHVSAAAVDIKRATTSFYEIGENQLGKVYSSIQPDTPSTAETKREAAPAYFEIGENQLGKVYSTVKPTNLPALSTTEIEKREPFEYVTASDDFTTKWISENVESGLQERGGLEKRASYVRTLTCMYLCHLNEEGISTLSTAQKVQFCLANCILQGATNDYFSRKYQDTYGSSFPNTANGK